MSKPEQWAEVTWGFVEAGDFVRKGDRVFRVERRSVDVDLNDKLSFILYSPGTGNQEGLVRPSSPISVRIVKDGQRTPAGQRDDGLSDAGEAALKAKLGAELLAHQDTSARDFRPWILAERFTADQLAMHLHQFHGLYTGQVKAKDGVELRDTHSAFHQADMRTQPETARRLPHVHDEKAFQEGL